MTVRLGDITDAEIEVSKPTKKEIFLKLQQNDINHEERLTSLQAGSAKIEVFNDAVLGFFDQYNSSELCGVVLFRSPQAFDIVNVRTTLLTDIAAGPVLIDVEKSSDFLTWNTIFTASGKPEIIGITTGTESGPVEFVTNGEVVAQNEWLRVNFETYPEDLKGIHIHIYGES